MATVAVQLFSGTYRAQPAPSRFVFAVRPRTLARGSTREVQ